VPSASADTSTTKPSRGRFISTASSGAATINGSPVVSQCAVT
jgi:hypothetical protein